MFRDGTRSTFITVPLSPCRPMPSIEEITDAPIVRDEATLVASQSGLMHTCPIDPAFSCLLESITYNREHGFDLEWDSKEGFKAWLDNKQTAQSIELRPSKIERGSALYMTNQIFRCACNGTGSVKPYQKRQGRTGRSKISGSLRAAPALYKSRCIPISLLYWGNTFQTIPMLLAWRI